MSQVQGITVVRTTGPYTDFKVEDENLFIDLPMFFALAVCCPAMTLLARLRMMVVGFLALSVVHFLGFALALKLAYVQFDLLNHGIHPGFTALNVIAPARRLIYSDLNLVLPFLAWGALYVWEEQRSRSRRHRR